MLTQRQEAFCRELAKGRPASRAYIDAGYNARGNAAEVNASRLLRKAQIRTRLAELQHRHAERVEVTVESLVRELEEASLRAMETRQVAAAVAASMGKAKLLGLIVDKAEIDATIRKPLRAPGAPAQMSLEEWTVKFGGGA